MAMGAETSKFMDPIKIGAVDTQTATSNDLFHWGGSSKFR